MGVFSASISESFDGGFIPELEINDVNAGALASDNFAEMAILGSVEVSAIHKSLVESIAAQEIDAVEEGYEVVYEASSLSSISEKIKSLIKKAIEKLKSLFEKAIAVFRSWTSSDKDFIKTYQTTFTKNWIKLKKLDMKVYTYNTAVRELFTGNGAEKLKDAGDMLDKVLGDDIFEGDRSIDDLLTLSDVDILNSIKSAFEKVDHADIMDSLRGISFTLITNNNTVSRMTTKEFSDELHDWYRNGDDSKDSMDKSDLEKNGYSSTDIISRLTNGEKATSNLNKAFNKSVKALNKEINDNNKKLNNIKYTDDNEKELNTLKAWVHVEYSAFLSTALECVQAWQGQWLQACKEYSRTCKSIATKVVAMGEKRLAQEESWDYGYDNDYSNGFMNSVIIK